MCQKDVLYLQLSAYKHLVKRAKSQSLSPHGIMAFYLAGIFSTCHAKISDMDKCLQAHLQCVFAGTMICCDNLPLYIEFESLILPKETSIVEQLDDLSITCLGWVQK